MFLNVTNAPTIEVCLHPSVMAVKFTMESGLFGQEIENEIKTRKAK